MKTIESFGVQHSSARMNERNVASIGDRNFQLHTHERIGWQYRIDTREKFGEAGACATGGENFIFVAAIGFHQVGQILGRERVDLVEYLNARAILDAEVCQDF